MTNTIDTLDGIIARAKAYRDALEPSYGEYDYIAIAPKGNGDAVLCFCDEGDVEDPSFVYIVDIPAFIFDMTDDEFSAWQVTETQRRADVEKQRLDELRAKEESHERAELARLLQKYGE